MTFNERLKELREEKKLNQRQAADALEVEPSKYNKWESGKNRPDFETLCKFAKFFNTTSDYLLGLSNVKHMEDDDDMGKFLELFFRFIKSEAVASVKLHKNFLNFETKFNDMLALFKKGTIDENLLKLWFNDQIKKCKGKSVHEAVNKMGFFRRHR